jgi:Ca2+-binding EF-hand superfamily protein
MITSSTSVSSLLQQLQQSVFSSLDTNADGVLSADEFSALGQNVPGAASSGPASSSGATATVQATSLAAAPPSFSSDILSSLLSLQNGDALSSFDPASPASNLVKGGDQNSDGTLSKTEFEQAYQSLGQAGGGLHHHHHHHGSVGGGSQTSAADNAFAAADTNGDGQVSTDELTNLLTQRQQQAETAAAQYQAVDSFTSSILNAVSNAANNLTTSPQTTTQVVA